MAWGHTKSRFKIQDPEINIRKSRSRNQDSEIKIQKSRSRSQDPEIKIQKSRSGNQDLEIKIWKSRSRNEDPEIWQLNPAKARVDHLLLTVIFGLFQLLEEHQRMIILHRNASVRGEGGGNFQ